MEKSRRTRSCYRIHEGSYVKQTVVAMLLGSLRRW
jgi:hypothetical protein